MIEVGDSFITDFSSGKHLHIVLAESSSDLTAFVFIVYISSEQAPFKDNTTLIQPGEHDFVTEESWVRHQNIIICQRNTIDETKFTKNYGQVSAKLLEKIQQGIHKSNKVSRRDKALFEEWMLGMNLR